MRILLIGYGKMGRAIEQVALRKGHYIVAKIDLDNNASLATINPKMIDVALEFSQPTAAYRNICQCLAKHIPVISGTTGWLAQKEALHAYCIAQQGTFFYAANFSIGMHILFKVNTWLAMLMDQYAAYDVTLTEEHHLEKKDAPSGTAIALAKEIIRKIHRKTTWEIAPIRQKDSLGILVKREKDIPGTHTITYHSSLDTLELKHTVHSREGFALGVVLVAEWIQGKQGIFTMEDFLQSATF
mmetsp:Transcript_9878/g.22802  ORF Transcript_9878/g.22802 Transcript_9878/m.22802 type:complete len:242 (-) Transcript_9878:500-1225(-)